MPDRPEIAALQQSLLEEIYKMLGLPPRSMLRPLLKPLFSPASQRFSRLAAGFDNDVKTRGFDRAARRFLSRFIHDIRVTGSEGVPAQGSLLVVSNHPGTYDALAIASCLPRRDLKIIASGVPFIRRLSASANHLIYSTPNTVDRMLVIRSIIRHLKNNGAVLIFPSGGIDPDPAIMRGALAELETWSPSLDVILRRVPSTRILVTAVSGVLHPGWVNSPIVRLRRGRRNQQRVAEFFQVIQQILLPGSLMLNPAVSFAEPLLLPSDGSSSRLPAILSHARGHFGKFSQA